MYQFRPQYSATCGQHDKERLLFCKKSRVWRNMFSYIRPQAALVCYFRRSVKSSMRWCECYQGLLQNNELYYRPAEIVQCLYGSGCLLLWNLRAVHSTSSANIVRIWGIPLVPVRSSSVWFHVGNIQTQEPPPPRGVWESETGRGSASVQDWGKGLKERFTLQEDMDFHLHIVNTLLNYSDVCTVYGIYTKP